MYGVPTMHSCTLNGKSSGEEEGGPPVFCSWEISVLGKQRRKHAG